MLRKSQHERNLLNHFKLVSVRPELVEGLEFFTLTGNLASQRQQYTFPVDYEPTLTQRIQHHWFRKLAVHPDC
jgi:hypothetical protein